MLLYSDSTKGKTNGRVTNIICLGINGKMFLVRKFYERNKKIQIYYKKLGLLTDMLDNTIDVETDIRKDYLRGYVSIVKEVKIDITAWKYFIDALGYNGIPDIPRKSAAPSTGGGKLLMEHQNLVRKSDIKPLCDLLTDTRWLDFHDEAEKEMKDEVEKERKRICDFVNYVEEDDT